jgi:primosomal protein N' (replication factor Y)
MHDLWARTALQCDVSLTYHSIKNQLRCHYCGYSIAKPTHCHSCSSVELTTKGFGTEQITRINKPFPDYKIGRMDQDTTAVNLVSKKSLIA